MKKPWRMAVLAVLTCACLGLFSCNKDDDDSPNNLNNGHEYVDLGLSVKWATCNVGASSPGDHGSYFAWGETSPKSEYTWTNLKYCTEIDNPNELSNDLLFSKYVTDSKYGSVDNTTVLDPEDDAAHANWGGGWRMPTMAEIQELMDNCTWIWTTAKIAYEMMENGTWVWITGRNGYQVVSKLNGNCIFLPAGGYRDGTDLICDNVGGAYWSSSLDEGNSSGARMFYFLSDDHDTPRTDRRKIARSVRPVCQ